MTTTGLLGGSFNPAHGGHRMISLFAIQALELDELWWLVSPGNPLKSQNDMAPLPARLASAQKITRRSRIRATAIEREMGTRYTVNTLAKLVRRYPKRRFIWIMGADNVTNFTRWRRWRDIARLMPIAVIARPGYDAMLLRVPQWPGSGGSSGVRTSVITGRCGARPRLYSCAFVPIHARQRRYVKPIPFGINAMMARHSGRRHA